MQGRLFLQESAGSAGIINPPIINAAAFAEIQLNAGLRRSGLSYTQDNYFQQLLGFRTPPDELMSTAYYDPRWREHPMNALLTWTGFQNNLSKNSPLSFRLRSGFGWAHDAYGEGGYPNEQPGPQSLTYHFAGGARVHERDQAGKGTAPYSLTAQYDRQRQWYSLPHHVDTGDGRIALSRELSRQHVNYYVAYDVKTVGDYWGERQLDAYPAAPDVVITAVRHVLGPVGRSAGSRRRTACRRRSCTRRRSTSG